MNNDKKTLSRTHILNPKTNRMIRIGGRIYNEMVKNNLLSLSKEDETNKVVYTGESKEELYTVGNTVKKYENQMNPPAKGKYFAQRGNKIRERKRTMSRIELTNKVQERCLDLYLENKHLFTPDMDKEKVQHILNDLLHKDLAGIPTKIKKKKKYIVSEVPKSNFYEITDTDLEMDYTDTELETDYEEED